MANSQLQQYRLGPWAGGSKPDFSPFVTGPQDVVSAANVDFREDGSIRKRRGYSKWSTSDPAAASWGRRLWSWRPVNAGEVSGDDFLFYLDTDNELYYVNTASSTTLIRANNGSNDISLGSSIVAATALGDVLYFTGRGSGTSAHSFNGSSWTSITDNTLNGSATEFPLAAFAITQHERIFAAHVKDGGTNHNSRVWWSDAGDGNTFQSTSWIDFDPNDGSAISGLAALGDRIVVFKEYSFYTLSGVDPDSFTVFKVSPDFGCLKAGQSIAQVDNKLYWFDYSTATVWSFDGAEYQPVDNPIQQRIRQGITSTGHIFGVHGFTYNDKYHLSIDWEEAGPDSDGRTKHTFVYHPKLNTWTEYSFGVQGTARIGNDLYGVGVSQGDTTPSTGVFRLFDESQLSDAGSNINAHFHTTWFAPNQDFTTDFRVRRIQVYLPGESASPATVMAALHTDWDGTTEVSSANISNNSTDNYVVGEIQPATTPVQSISFHIENNSDDEWEVNAIDCVVSRRALEQGVES